MNVAQAIDEGFWSCTMAILHYDFAQIFGMDKDNLTNPSIDKAGSVVRSFAVDVVESTLCMSNFQRYRCR